MPELRTAEPLPERARECLSRALGALDAHTDAPLRLAGYVSDGSCEVFELHEEFENGCRRTPLPDVCHRLGRDALLIPLDSKTLEET